MPSKQFDTIWKAEPHTIAKIELLQAYLKAWLSILGIRRRGQQLLYIDGFAGPGEYTNHPTGSPIAAIEAANSVMETHARDWIAGDIHCAFIDSDPKRMDHLKRRIARLPLMNRLHVYMHGTTFVEGIGQVRKEICEPFTKGHPLFVFIDPFGAKGVPFGTVSEILSSSCSEVLINLDADGIDRIFHAGDDACADANLTDIFGNDCWRSELSREGIASERCRRVLDLYKRRLRTINDVKYVFSFEMKGHHATLNYYLVFASQNRLGLQKMKEAMRSIGQNGDYSFSDAGVGQMSMFQADQGDEIERFAGKVYGFCKGRRLSYQEVEDYVLNETSCSNPKKILKCLEDQGRLRKVEVKPGDVRRKGYFAEEVVVAVTFTDSSVPTSLFD